MTGTILLFAGLLGCEVTVEDYASDRAAADCALAAGCDQLAALGHPDEDACVEAANLDQSWLCTETFDPAAARACLDALSTATCATVASGETDLWACERACVDDTPSIW